MQSIRSLVTAAGLLVAGAVPGPVLSQETTTVQNGKTVGIEYTLKLENGEVVDSNVGKEALVFTHGEGRLLPALEQALTGLEVDASRAVTLAPEDAYGTVDAELYRDVEVDLIPEGSREVGTMLIASDASGNQRPVRVHEVRDEVIVLDYNHPLAGQVLLFDVRVVSIE